MSPDLPNYPVSFMVNKVLLPQMYVERVPCLNEHVSMPDPADPRAVMYKVVRICTIINENFIHTYVVELD